MDVENKTRVILDWFFMGGTVEYNGSIYQMSDDYDICVIGKKLTLGEGRTFDNDAETCLLRTWMSFQDFVQFCEKLTDEQINGIVANISLNKIKEKR